ncbi:hypothetical protein GGI25_002385 [Coemansia spiralis]|uniref:Uncharacterized protein n=2 Tax=Coemansia TaxID=4863 RepID=A0A9W8KYK0_9FUNG|nr:hypothetical protein EDC05_003531 [Coemansia umbellata]KAJ2622191.1 hypothetical protein GGI26_003486 [Coemansia sp. RSA 1358]KAJ2678400.1 hypothetical protein GGI25_002385 [Coemansia spiralis]
MAQTLTNSMQSPVTPSRQLGAARGQRRTPSSRTKTPYARPASVKGENSDNDYQSDSSSGFLKGMRSLVQRLWGTSLKSSSGSSDSASAKKGKHANANANANSKLKQSTKTRASAAEPSAKKAEHQLSARAAELASSPSTFSAASAVSAIPDFSRNAATVAERTRARRPTAESLFAPSPFAYNKRLAAATPSVANLRDVDRVKDQSPALLRRHSVGRIDSRHPRLSTGTPASASHAAISDSAGHTMPSRYVSPSDARRLLNTISSIHTPILDARSRSTGSQALSSTSSASAYNPTASPATISYGSSPMPFRRLPLSLLALSDTPEKAHRAPRVDTASVLDKETLRRSSSLKSIPRLQNKAPSLARTIQLQQARKAVAERLMRNKTADSVSGADAEFDSDYYATFGASALQEPNGTSEPVRTSTVHERDDSDDRKVNKRRRAADGEAVDISGDVEMSDGDDRKGKKAFASAKRHGGRRSVSTRRTMSAANNSVRWRFSARFEPMGDKDAEASSESDEDREALASKVPLSKIRGGELIGLSLRPTTSAASSANGSGASAVRSTGFGGNRTPIPIVNEVESEAASAFKPAAAPAPVTSTPNDAAPAAAFTSAALPTTTNDSTLFGNLAPKAQSESKNSEPGSEKVAASTAASFTPAVATTTTTDTASTDAASTDAATKPAFSFGKPAAPESANDSKLSLNTPISKPADTSKVFNFGKPSTSESASDAKPPTSSETPAFKPAASSGLFSFGKTPAATTSVPESTANSVEEASKLAASIAETAKSEKPLASTASSKPAPTSGFSFSFGSNTAASTGDTSTTQAAPSFSLKGAGDAGPSSGFSFGLGTTSKLTSTPAAASSLASEKTSKPAFSFGLGAANASASASTDKKETLESKAETPDAGKPASNIFGGIGTSALGSTSSTTDKKDAGDSMKKPLFSFGTTNTTASDSDKSNIGTFGASTLPVSDAFSKEHTTTSSSAEPAKSFSVPEAKSTTAFGFKPAGGFSFGKPAETALSGPGLTASASGANNSSTSATGITSFSLTAPVKTIDLTAGTTYASFTSAAAADTTASTIAALPAPTPSVFSGLGKRNELETDANMADTMSNDAANNKDSAKSSRFSGFDGKPAFSGFSLSGPSTAIPALSKPPAFGSLAPSQPSISGGDVTAKKRVFSFGSLNTPSAASFESTTVPTPAVTSFGSLAASAAVTIPSFGAPAATPSAFNFGVASSPAGTPSATPATPAFTFNGGQPKQRQVSTTNSFTGSSFGNVQPSAANNAFGSASTQSTANNTSVSGFGGGFGSASATAPNNNTFGSSSTPGFGSALGGNGVPAPSGTGFGAGSTGGGINFSSNVSTTSGFGSGPPTGGFGQQSNISTSSAFNSQPNSGLGSSAGNNGFGASSSTSTFGTTAPSTAGVGPQFTFGQGTNTPTGSFQFNAGGHSAFGDGSSVVNSTPTTPFAFGSNTSVQGGSQPGPFQFTSGVAQQSNTGVGGMSLGRVTGGSNVSTSSHGRRIARPRTRRPR